MTHTDEKVMVNRMNHNFTTHDQQTTLFNEESHENVTKTESKMTPQKSLEKALGRSGSGLQFKFKSGIATRQEGSSTDHEEAQVSSSRVQKM